MLMLVAITSHENLLQQHYWALRVQSHENNRSGMCVRTAKEKYYHGLAGKHGHDRLGEKITEVRGGTGRQSTPPSPLPPDLRLVDSLFGIRYVAIIS